MWDVIAPSSVTAAMEEAGIARRLAMTYRVFFWGTLAFVVVAWLVLGLRRLVT